MAEYINVQVMDGVSKEDWQNFPKEQQDKFKESFRASKSLTYKNKNFVLNNRDVLVVPWGKKEYIGFYDEDFKGVLDPKINYREVIEKL